MKLITLSIIFALNINANNNYICIEKIDQLKKLKAEKYSTAEKVASFLLSGGYNALSIRKKEKELNERIRVSELELKSCSEKR